MWHRYLPQSLLPHPTSVLLVAKGWQPHPPSSTSLPIRANGLRDVWEKTLQLSGGQQLKTDRYRYKSLTLLLKAGQLCGTLYTPELNGCEARVQGRVHTAYHKNSTVLSGLHLKFQFKKGDNGKHSRYLWITNIKPLRVTTARTWWVCLRLISHRLDCRSPDHERLIGSTSWQWW